MAKKTTKTNGANGKSSAAFETAVARVLTSANALLTSLQGLGMAVLTDEERVHTMGKLRLGEPEAMTSVLDTMDAYPAFFESLAAKDNGTDPNVLETQPSRDALARFEALGPLSEVLVEMLTVVGDGMIANGQSAKEVTVPAYAIGKAVAVTNAKLRASMAKSITFYGGKARQTVAAKKRTAKRAAKTAKNAKTGASALS